MSRRDRSSDDGYPPGDGWIVLAPGAGLFIDVERPPARHPDELKRMISRYRGAVLADAFHVEEQLLKLALANQFGTNDALIGGDAYRDREDNWRRENSLKRKIERAKPIVRERLPKVEADSLVDSLAAFGRLRNLWAHYPFWLIPIHNEEGDRTVDFVVHIADNNHVFRVDDDQARVWGLLITRVGTDVENLIRRMTGAPPLLPDGSPPPAC